MARKLRLEYAGAVYRVLNQGDRREVIFEDDLDRRWFLETLAAAQNRNELASGKYDNLIN